MSVSNAGSDRSLNLLSRASRIRKPSCAPGTSPRAGSAKTLASVCPRNRRRLIFPPGIKLLVLELGRRSDPAADLGFVAQIFGPKFLFEIGLFTFDHAFLQDQCERQRKSKTS